MHKYRLIEIFCIAAAIFFIVSTNKAAAPTDMTAEEIYNEISREFDFSDLEARDKLQLKERLGIQLPENASFVYFSSDDVMNVNELLIMVAEGEDMSSVVDALTDYTDERYKLFNGYAPEQAALLKGAVIRSYSDIVIFCIDEKADEIYQSVLSVL